MKEEMTLNSVEINKEFEALCIKHNIPTAALIIESKEEKVDNENVKTQFIFAVHSQDKTKEQSIMDSLSLLFVNTGLSHNNLKIVADFAKEKQEEQELYFKEQNLSKEDRERLNKIRLEKHDCVITKDYEKACELRTEERAILGIKSTPLTKLDMDDVMNYKSLMEDYKPLMEDIEKVHSLLQNTIKGFKRKTSKDWYEEIPKELGFSIMDPDGWDRSNYDYSFCEELITKEEFVKRVFESTVMSNKAANEFFTNWQKI